MSRKNRPTRKLTPQSQRIAIRHFKAGDKVILTGTGTPGKIVEIVRPGIFRVETHRGAANVSGFFIDHAN